MSSVWGRLAVSSCTQAMANGEESSVESLFHASSHSSATSTGQWCPVLPAALWGHLSGAQPRIIKPSAFTCSAWKLPRSLDRTPQPPSQRVFWLISHFVLRGRLCFWNFPRLILCAAVKAQQLPTRHRHTVPLASITLSHGHGGRREAKLF